MSDPRPIGLFDSGVGGLTVLRAVRRLLPRERTVYLGDSARAPYGSRPDEEIVTLSGECLDHLVADGVKAIVVACSTSSSVALAQLIGRSPVPVLGIVRPGAAAAAMVTRTGRIGVIATETTIRSGSFPRAISLELPGADILAHATPALVPLVEAGELDGPRVRAVVRESLDPIVAAVGEPIDTLLLGCTHYPLLGPVIADVVGPDVVIIDPAEAIASALAVLLQRQGLEAPSGQVADHRLQTTGDVEAFRAATTRLFPGPRADVRQVTLGAASRVSIPVAAGSLR